MALYRGENVIITHTAEVDDEPLTPADVDGVFVTIFDVEGTVLVDETEMIWNPDQERWEYDWDTSTGATPDGLAAGSYWAKCTIYSGSDINWEFKKIKLKRNKVGD